MKIELIDCISGKRYKNMDCDGFEKELQEDYDKLMKVDIELTRLNGGNPLVQPLPKCAHTPSSYVLKENLNLQLLPDEGDTFFIGLSGTSEAIKSNIMKFREICGNGRGKNPQQIYDAYKLLISV
jgi:hypothetical protein